jgi:hypothetical protein
MAPHFRRQYYIPRSLIKKREGTIPLETYRKNWQIIAKQSLMIKEDRTWKCPFGFCKLATA